MRIGKEFYAAARESGRPVSALLLEALALRFSTGKIGISEYFDFRLHLRDLSFREKTAFGGWRAQAVLEDILVDDYGRFLGIDKVTMYSLLRGHGLPIPRMKAVFRSKRPRSVLNLSSPKALAGYLRSPSTLPIYMKPSFGAFGRKNIFIAGLKKGELRFGDGSATAVDSFCQSLDDGRSLGWILQEPLKPHADIAALCGEKISGIRVHSFLSRRGPEITHAVFKINTGREDCDNFRHGATNNMAAAVDVPTGKVTRVVAGTGLRQVINPPHPVTGREMVGFQLPYWSELKEVVRDAQLVFPGYLCPGWDVAICDDGPKILEVNFLGDLDLPQFASRKGFMDERLIGMMRDHGVDRLLKGGAGATKRTDRNNRLGRRKHHWNW